MNYSKILRLPLFPFWLIAPLGLTGIAIALFRHRGSPILYLFIACHYVSVVLFFIISRFRVPIMTALIPFAAFSIMTFYEQLRCRLYKKCCLHLISFLALILLMIPWHTERIRANDYWMLAGLMKEQGMYQNAAEQLRKCLEVGRGPVDDDTLRCLIEEFETHSDNQSGVRIQNSENRIKSM